MPDICEIWDEPKAKTRRRNFNYFEDGGLLHHVSRYASRTYIKREGGSVYTVFEVSLERIKGKDLYHFSFTNSGGFTVYEIGSSELRKPEKPGRYERDRKDIGIKEVRQLAFNIESQRTNSNIAKIYDIFLPMIEEIREFQTDLRMGPIVTSERVSDFLRDEKWGLASCLCHLKEQGRNRCLNVVCRLIYSLWTLMMLHKSLKSVKIERGWSTEQGSKYPASIFVNPKNKSYTCWFEPQIIQEVPEEYKGPLSALFEGAVAWKRTNLLVAKGRKDSIDEVEQFDMLISCKISPFDTWWKNGDVIADHLLPYKQLFPSKKNVIVSLHEIPNLGSKSMEEIGFVVIENFHPFGRGVERFAEVIQR